MAVAWGEKLCYDGNKVITKYASYYNMTSVFGGDSGMKWETLSTKGYLFKKN